MGFHHNSQTRCQGISDGLGKHESEVGNWASNRRLPPNYQGVAKYLLPPFTMILLIELNLISILMTRPRDSRLGVGAEKSSSLSDWLSSPLLCILEPLWFYLLLLILLCCRDGSVECDSTAYRVSSSTPSVKLVNLTPNRPRLRDAEILGTAPRPK